MDELYYLQNVRYGYFGNSPYWWEKNNSGYTPWLDEAKKFTNEEADKVIRSTQGSHEWKKWRVTEIDRTARRIADVQTLSGAEQES